MKVPKHIQQLADELGADIEMFTDESSYNFEALAPDGMEWVESGSVSLVCRVYLHTNDLKRDKKEAFEDLFNRMKQGLQDENIDSL